MANDKKVKIVSVKEEKLVDLINNIVETTIKERNLIPAPVENKKKKTWVVTEGELNKLLEKGYKIKTIKRKK